MERRARVAKWVPVALCSSADLVGTLFCSPEQFHDHIGLEVGMLLVVVVWVNARKEPLRISTLYVRRVVSMQEKSPEFNARIARRDLN